MRTATLVALSLVAACEPQAANGVSSPEVDVTARDYRMAPLPKAQVVLKDVYGGQHLVRVEVAATNDARTRGLMWRTELKDGEGMLFLFSEDEVHRFWMRNTLIPLDMLFLDAKGRVLGIVENAEPKTLTPRFVGTKSRHVLELPAGTCAKLGLAPGSAVELRGISMIAVEA